MIPTNLLVILPILIPLTGALIALLLRHRRSLRDGWTLAVMVVSMLVSFYLLAVVWQNGETAGLSEWWLAGAVWHFAGGRYAVGHLCGHGAGGDGDGRDLCPGQ